MELRHIYTIASTLNELFKTDDMVGADLSDLEVKIKLSSNTLYGIDREFYKETNGTLDGFDHKNEINAIIDGVHFNMVGG